MQTQTIVQSADKRQQQQQEQHEVGKRRKIIIIFTQQQQQQSWRRRLQKNLPISSRKPQSKLVLDKEHEEEGEEEEEGSKTATARNARYILGALCNFICTSFRLGLVDRELKRKAKNTENKNLCVVCFFIFLPDDSEN